MFGAVLLPCLLCWIGCISKDWFLGDLGVSGRLDELLPGLVERNLLCGEGIIKVTTLGFFPKSGLCERELEVDLELVPSAC